MNYLEPVYHNNIGATYILKDEIEESITSFEKIQLQLGDIAIILDQQEMKNLLVIIDSAKKGCQCDDCGKTNPFKTIKCDTPLAVISFKSTKQNIEGLENLIKGTIFQLEMNSILDLNDIE